MLGGLPPNQNQPKAAGGEDLHLWEVHSDFVVHIEISGDGDVDVYALPP